MKSFAFDAYPGRVVFGAGAIHHLLREVERLGASRGLVLSTPQQAELASDLSMRLGERSVGIHPHAVMHVPIEVARTAVEETARLGADCVVAAGGGSTIGLAKAIALRSALPILAVPTTYAGSEMTPIYALTEGGLKSTGKDARVLPKIVIYDPCLTLDLPLKMSITSGFNAIAHAAEALYADNANPISKLMAEEGLRALVHGLPGLKEDLRDLKSRGDCLYGALGFAVPCWEYRTWRCITSFATCWVAAGICRTPKPIRSFCRMCWPTTLLPYRMRWGGSSAP